MSFANRTGGHPDISIVIASYNSAPWLPSTLNSLAAALAHTTWNSEVVIVDDGSTDETAAVLASIGSNFPVPLTVISQENKGRFLARWAGVQAARAERVLIVDSRLIVHEHALEYLQHNSNSDGVPQVWNGHVMTDLTAPLVGHFWSVPTHIFWSTYLANPKPTLITVENFDRVPKGTGFLFVPRELFIQACLDSWPTDNAHLVSDDTKLLRYVVDRGPILLDPKFSATYRPRTTISQCLSHSRGRGTLFVDSYAGTTKVRSAALVILGIAPPLALASLLSAALTASWALFWSLAAFSVVAIVAPAVIAYARKCPGKAVAAYLVYILPFGVAFWSGLIRGLWVHRKAFHRRASQQGGFTN